MKGYISILEFWRVEQRAYVAGGGARRDDAQDYAPARRNRKRKKGADIRALEMVERASAERR
ncbi:MAG: hypothetical protein WAN43_00580 [Rhodomicrobium sp.]